jgi:hypothetical protein
MMKTWSITWLAVLGVAGGVGVTVEPGAVVVVLEVVLAGVDDVTGDGVEAVDALDALPPLLEDDVPHPRSMTQTVRPMTRRMP